jgi:hypothetical protein
MSPFDNAATIPALAAIEGSVAGALGSTVNAWIVQRHQDRRELVAKKVVQLERLYSAFINESTRLLVGPLPVIESKELNWLCLPHDPLHPHENRGRDTY